MVASTRESLAAALSHPKVLWLLGLLVMGASLVQVALDHQASQASAEVLTPSPFSLLDLPAPEGARPHQAPAGDNVSRVMASLGPEHHLVEVAVNGTLTSRRVDAGGAVLWADRTCVLPEGEVLLGITAAGTNLTVHAFRPGRTPEVWPLLQFEDPDAAGIGPPECGPSGTLDFEANTGFTNSSGVVAERRLLTRLREGYAQVPAYVQGGTVDVTARALLKNGTPVKVVTAYSPANGAGGDFPDNMTGVTLVHERTNAVLWRATLDAAFVGCPSEVVASRVVLACETPLAGVGPTPLAILDLENGNVLCQTDRDARSALQLHAPLVREVEGEDGNTALEILDRDGSRLVTFDEECQPVRRVTVPTNDTYPGEHVVLPLAAADYDDVNTTVFLLSYHRIIVDKRISSMREEHRNVELFAVWGNRSMEPSAIPVGGRVLTAVRGSFVTGDGILLQVEGQPPKLVSMAPYQELRPGHLRPSSEDEEPDKPVGPPRFQPALFLVGLALFLAGVERERARKEDPWAVVAKLPEPSRRKGPP